MTSTTTIYAPMNSGNEFVHTLFRLHNTWERQTGNRTPYPYCDGQRIRVNQNGIGIEMDGVIATLPLRLAGLVPSAVVVTDKHIKGDTAMVPGMYKYGRYTTATVTARIWTPNNHPAYLNTDVVVTSTSLRSAVQCYRKLRVGAILPQAAWPIENKDGDKQ